MCSETNEKKENASCCNPKDFMSMIEKCLEGKEGSFDCSSMMEKIKNAGCCGTATEETKKDSCCG